MSVVRNGLLVSAALAAPTAVLPPPLESGPETADPSRLERRVLTQVGIAGRLLFQENCAQCHGSDGRGSVNGPSLLHRDYAPDRLSQREFHKAVTNGVPATKWTFGDMPAIALGFNDIELIARFIREVRDPEKYAP